MYNRLDDMPVFEFIDGEIESHYYNNVQVALKRIGNEIRLQIPKLKHLDLILQKDAWIIVDRVLNDMPVVAWTGFQVEHRASLHEPIKCRIQSYHEHAKMILEHTLDSMDLIIGDQLAELSMKTTDKVISFKK